MTTPADGEVLALDTSVAVPLLMRSHEAHTGVTAALAGRELALTAHSLAETYSVLTRLPGDARVAPPDAARLIDANFRATLLLGPSTARAVPAVLAALGIAGGAVYDALVGLAAAENDVALASRDARALGTYAAVGAVTKILSA